jgi:hypothetical protein
MLIPAPATGGPMAGLLLLPALRWLPAKVRTENCRIAGLARMVGVLGSTPGGMVPSAGQRILDLEPRA